jgi:predicted DNA-binding transcriptional regulator YafY
MAFAMMRLSSSVIFNNPKRKGYPQFLLFFVNSSDSMSACMGTSNPLLAQSTLRRNGKKPLPPLMFSDDEIEAMVLGSRWVAQRADTQLKIAAQNVLAKISALLPTELKHQLETSGLLVPPGKCAESKDSDLILIRKAIRLERKIELEYQDLQNNHSTRILWPIALGFFEEVHLMVGWCELRQDFRHFRTDRILQVSIKEQKYSERRQSLLKKWRTLHNIPQSY